MTRLIQTISFNTHVMNLKATKINNKTPNFIDVLEAKTDITRFSQEPASFNLYLFALISHQRLFLLFNSYIVNNFFFI